MVRLSIPDPALVILMGASGSGKSTFARQHFRLTEIVSSDACRGMVSDDETNMAANDDAFALLHFIVEKRLSAGRLTVADATNVRSDARGPLLHLARMYRCAPVAIVLALSPQTCFTRNRARRERIVPDAVIHHQLSHLRDSIDALTGEGFDRVYVLRTEDEVARAVIERTAAERLGAERPSSEST